MTNAEDTFERDKKFYELGIEHNKVLIRTMIECLEIGGDVMLSKEQVIKILKELLND